MALFKHEQLADLLIYKQGWHKTESKAQRLKKKDKTKKYFWVIQFIGEELQFHFCPLESIDLHVEMSNFMVHSQIYLIEII